MHKNKKIIIFGDQEYAEIAYEYFTHDSTYEVVAFCVEQDYLHKATFCQLPVVAFEEISVLYPASDYDMHVAIVYTQLNRVREKIFLAAKAKGYRLASYISSRAFVWHNANIGENCFIFENNVLQPFVEIQNNVVLWSGNHIGHGSVIEENCFISSHVVISGSCRIGRNTFIGVNSTLGNHVTIGCESWISPAAMITSSVPAHSLVKGLTSEVAPLNEKLLFKILSSVKRLEKID